MNPASSKNFTTFGAASGTANDTDSRHEARGFHGACRDSAGRHVRPNRNDNAAVGINPNLLPRHMATLSLQADNKPLADQENISRHMQNANVAEFNPANSCRPRLADDADVLAQIAVLWRSAREPLANGIDSPQNNGTEVEKEPEGECQQPNATVVQAEPTGSLPDGYHDVSSDVDMLSISSDDDSWTSFDDDSWTSSDDDSWTSFDDDSWTSSDDDSWTSSDDNSSTSSDNESLTSSDEDSLIVLERLARKKCALTEGVLREPGAEDRREGYPAEQAAVTDTSISLCEHYQRKCRVKFPCCNVYYACHHCHNNAGECSNKDVNARDATQVECSVCYLKQEISANSQHCQGCQLEFAKYFCSKCKHLTSKDKNPYHCDKCGICRINKDQSFHCEVCNICLDKRLEGNHTCRPDSGHDKCCICLVDSFSGCQILPCFHKVHRECAIAMLQNGIRSCLVCRHSFCPQISGIGPKK